MSGLLFLFPVVYGLLALWMSGIRWFNHIDYFGSIGVDEVIYYKLVESVVRYGGPFGFFGAEESRALIGGHYAWSPLLYGFFIIWGALFGWSPTAPIVCNFVLMGAALACWYLLISPTKKQLVRMLVLYMGCTYLTRYLFGTMVETTINFLLILFGSFAICYTWKRESKGILIALFVISVLLVWMRPYFLGLVLLPVGFLFLKERKRKGVFLIGLMSPVLALAGYALISKLFCASYFSGLWHNDWLILIKEHPFSGVLNIAMLFFSTVKELLHRGGCAFFEEGFSEDAAFVILLLFFVWKLYVSVKETNKKEIILWGGSLLLYLSMLLAVSLVYRLGDSYRHLNSLVVYGVFLFACCGFGEKHRRWNLLVIVSIIWVYFIIGDFALVNVSNSENLQIMDDGRVQLAEAMEISAEADGWDNTMLWTYFYNGNKPVWWKGLYAVPAGTGLNLCTDGYIMENYGQLKARYIYLDESDDLNGFLDEKGASCIASYGPARVWQIR